MAKLRIECVSIEDYTWLANNLYRADFQVTNADTFTSAYGYINSIMEGEILESHIEDEETGLISITKIASNFNRTLEIGKIYDIDFMEVT